MSNEPKEPIHPNGSNIRSIRGGQQPGARLPQPQGPPPIQSQRKLTPEEQRQQILAQTIEIAKRGIQHIDRVKGDGENLRAILYAYIAAAQKDFAQPESIRAWNLCQQHLTRMLDREDLPIVRRQEILDVLMKFIVGDMMAS